MITSIGAGISLVTGCALGLLLLGRFSSGLERDYGWWLAAFAGLGAVAAVLSRDSRRLRSIAAYTAAYVLGFALALLSHPPSGPTDLSYYNSAAGAEAVVVQGVVSNDPVLNDRSQRLRIEADSVLRSNDPSPMPVHGAMYALIPRYPEYSIGEVLTLRGVLTTPPEIEGFDYAAYLARQGVRSYMTFPGVRSLGRSDAGVMGLILAQRSKARDGIRRIVPEPQAAIAVGVVVGDRSSMSDEIREDFRRSGTIHILAISGQNIALLTGLAWLIFGGGQARRRMPVWLTLLLVALLAIYTVFTGASPSVVRAAIMGAVLLIAPVVGRRYDPVAALTVTAAVMLALDPDVLADGGFQLSFLAMLGIAVVSPRLSAFADRHSVPALLSAPLAVGIGAQALMWPVGAMLAGQVSLVSPLATLFADIALVPLMVSGILTAILSGVPLLAAVPGFVAWLSAEWLLICARLWGSLPLATITVDWLTPVHAAAYYLALIALLNLRKGLALVRGVPHPRPEFTLFALGAVAALTWLGAIWLLLSG